MDLLDSSSSEEEGDGPSERVRRERAAAAAEARRLRDEEAAGLNERVDEYLEEHPARDSSSQEEEEEEDNPEASPEEPKHLRDDGDLGDEGGYDSVEEGGDAGHVSIPRKGAAVESPPAGDANGVYSSENNADDEHTLETEESEASQIAPFEEEDDPDLDGQAADPSVPAAGSPPPDRERADHQQENVLVAAAMSSQQSFWEDDKALSHVKHQQQQPSASALPAPRSPKSSDEDAEMEDASAAATAGGTAVAGEDGDAAAPVASDEDNDNPDDCGYMPDAEVTEEEKKPSKAKGKAAKAIDPGYLPDAEATEEEQPGPKKEEKPAGAIDPGYEAEASEVEAADAIRSRRDLREQEQRRTGTVFFVEQQDAPSSAVREGPPPPPVTSTQSIDDGYLPTDDEGHQTDNDPSRRALLSPGMKEAVTAPSIDKGYEPEGTMTEEERDGGAGAEKKSTAVAPKNASTAEDDGYHADGNTDAGEATEEDQPPDNGGATLSREGAGETPSNPSPRPSALAEAAAGIRTINDEVSSEGYLAEENTEEEPSETEERNNSGAGPATEDGGAEEQPPLRAAVGNVLVTTATGESGRLGFLCASFARLHSPSPQSNQGFVRSILPSTSLFVFSPAAGRKRGRRHRDKDGRRRRRTI